jgi:hypothetical protein
MSDTTLIDPTKGCDVCFLAPDKHPKAPCGQCQDKNAVKVLHEFDIAGSTIPLHRCKECITGLFAGRSIFRCPKSSSCKLRFNSKKEAVAHAEAACPKSANLPAWVMFLPNLCSPAAEELPPGVRAGDARKTKTLDDAAASAPAPAGSVPARAQKKAALSPSAAAAPAPAPAAPAPVAAAEKKTAAKKAAAAATPATAAEKKAAEKETSAKIAAEKETAANKAAEKTNVGKKVTAANANSSSSSSSSSSSFSSSFSSSSSPNSHTPEQRSSTSRLTTTTKAASSLSSHSSSSNPVSVEFFKCPTCDVKCKSLGALRVHECPNATGDDDDNDSDEEEVQEEFKCLSCRETLNTAEELEAHMTEKHPPKLLTYLQFKPYPDQCEYDDSDLDMKVMEVLVGPVLEPKGGTPGNLDKLYNDLYNEETGVLIKRAPTLRSAFPVYLSRLKNNMKECYDELDLGRTMTEKDIEKLSARDEYLKMTCEKYHCLKKPKEVETKSPKVVGKGKRRNVNSGGGESKKGRTEGDAQVKERARVLNDRKNEIEIELQSAKGQAKKNLEEELKEVVAEMQKIVFNFFLM